MNTKGFDKFFWGFLFVMFDFKIFGFDILPDLVGYLFFAAGFSALAAGSIYFVKGGRLNIAMILVSLLYIYEPPSQNQGQLLNLGPFGLLGIPIAILSLVLGLMVVYYLFMGIKELAARQDKQDIFDEADTRWREYLFLQFAALLSIVLILIPLLAMVLVLVMLVISIVLMLNIMKFMRKCGECL